MITAYASRVFLWHDRGFDEYTCCLDGHVGEDKHFVCNCPICHAEEVVATAPESVEYHPFVTVVECEYGVLPTASANSVVISSSLRGPPCLS